MYTCIYVHRKYIASLKFMIACTYVHIYTLPNTSSSMPFIHPHTHLYASYSYWHIRICSMYIRTYIPTIFFAPVLCNGTLVTTAPDGKCIHEHSPTHAHMCIHTCDSNTLINLVIILHNRAIKLAHKVPCISIYTTIHAL